MPIRAKDENGLTYLQRRFCEEYVKDFDGKNAYLRASENCKPSSAAQYAHSLLQIPKVKDYILKLQKVIYEGQFVNYERIAGELAEIGFHSNSEKNRLQALSQLSKILGLEKTIVAADINQTVDIKVGIVDDADKPTD